MMPLSKRGSVDQLDGDGPAARSVFAGDASDIADDLKEFATGVSFCTYPDESPVVTKAKLTPEAVAPHHDILIALQQLQPNLSFPKLTLESAMRLIASRRGWKMSGKTLEDWEETLTRRVRNMCRVVGQALAKGPIPTWLEPLVSMGEFMVVERGDMNHDDLEEGVLDEDQEQQAQPRPLPPTPPLASPAAPQPSQQQIATIARQSQEQTTAAMSSQQQMAAHNNSEHTHTRQNTCKRPRQSQQQPTQQHHQQQREETLPQHKKKQQQQHTAHVDEALRQQSTPPQQSQCKANQGSRRLDEDARQQRQQQQRRQQRQR